MIPVTDISFHRADAADRKTGILAYVNCVVHGDLRIDGLVIRLNRDGRLYLAFPATVSRRGRRRYPVAPVNEGVRREIEEAILVEWRRFTDAEPAIVDLQNPQAASRPGGSRF